MADMRPVYLRFRNLMPEEMTVTEVADLCTLIMADYAPTKPEALRIAGLTALTVQSQRDEAFTDEMRMN